jgi:hypothetical protein
VLSTIVTSWSAWALSPDGHFVVSADATTVADSKTGLVWQRDVPNVTKTWEEARAWCNANMSGLRGTGWRLPSVEELVTIIDSSLVQGCIDATVFPNTPWGFYWTSTPFAQSVYGGAWMVSFYNCRSGTAGGNVSNRYNFRCVR